MWCLRAFDNLHTVQEETPGRQSHRKAASYRDPAGGVQRARETV